MKQELDELNALYQREDCVDGGSGCLLDERSFEALCNLLQKSKSLREARYLAAFVLYNRNDALVEIWKDHMMARYAEALRPMDKIRALIDESAKHFAWEVSPQASHMPARLKALELGKTFAAWPYLAVALATGNLLYLIKAEEQIEWQTKVEKELQEQVNRLPTKLHSTYRER